MLILPAMTAPVVCAVTSDPRRLLDAYRVASSASVAQRGTAIGRYDYHAAGLDGEATSTIDLGTGRYRKEQRAGIVADGEGFDGRRAWMRDLSLFVKPQEGGDRMALAVNEAYRNADLWWRSDRGGARLDAIGCGGIRVAPRDGKPFEAWFDVSTHLLACVREIRSFGTTVETSFSGWERHGGRLVPGRITTTYGDDPNTSETLRLRSFSMTPPQSGAAYAMPRTNPSDWHLPANGRVTLPFRLLNNHIVVDVKIDGRGPFPFLVDTGGHNILTPSTLASLALSSEGVSPSSGAGETTVSNGYARVREIDAGGAVLHEQTVVTLDFSPPDVEGLTLGGMLGVEFLERFVVTVDYAAGTITLIDPNRLGKAERRTLGSAIPMRFYVHMPQIEGTIDGRPARLNVDTGARDELTVISPFVAANGLRGDYAGGVMMTTGWGVGGPSRTYAVRANMVSLGPVKVQRPVIGLSAATRGSFADASYDANVGSGLLKRFVVTFDYARETMYLRPIARPDPDVGRVDRVGMWLNEGERGLQVMDLVQGGPAEQAGLRVGDVVTMIGGVPVQNQSLSDTRRALKLAPLSMPIAVAYRRVGASGTVQVRPRDLIAN